jgi:hypothetical protein
MLLKVVTNREESTLTQESTLRRQIGATFKISNPEALANTKINEKKKVVIILSIPMTSKNLISERG